MTGARIKGLKEFAEKQEMSVILFSVYLRKRVKKDVFEKNPAIDEFGCRVIRRSVHDIYDKNETIPSLNKLLPETNDNDQF